MTRLSEMTVVKEMGKQSEPTFPLGWTNSGRKTLDTTDKVHPVKGLVIPEYLGDGNISFPCE